MKTTILALALLLPASAAWAQTPPPPAAPAPAAAPGAAETFDMPCSMFKRNADGSWHATQPMTLQPTSGPIALKTSTNFKPGTLFAGFDLAAALDGACKN